METNKFGDNRQINVRAVYDDGESLKEYSNRLFDLENLSAAYDDFEKWCFSFACENWQICLDERTPSKIIEFVSKLISGDKSMLWVVFKEKYQCTQKLCSVILEIVNKE